MIFDLRNAHEKDSIEMMRIQQLSYQPFLHEDQVTFIKIIDAQMSIVAISCKKMIGYGLVHTIEDEDSPPLLNHISTCIVENSIPNKNIWTGNIFIHDVAVDPDIRGCGVATCIVEYIINQAKNAKSITLISVQGSRFFWEKHGFRMTGLMLPNSYGPDAIHMKHQ